MTQLYQARQGNITEQMKRVAKDERLTPELVRDEIAAGKMIIPANVNHPHGKPIAIGRKASCKINANIGTSPLASGTDEEFEKLDVAIKYGADAVMDLSTGEDLDAIREAIIARSTAPVGTVPIYEAAQHIDTIEEMEAEELLRLIEKQSRQGVDFITVHCGLLKEHVPLAIERLTGIVSRGGALMARWMMMRNEENPLYTHYDELLKICRKHDMGLSLGDGLRPGSLADASDDAQFAELEVLADLTRRAQAADVQVMVEGPGHVPFNEVRMNIEKQIELCDGAPFYVLGPIVTDIAAGYDHIASAIGGTMAAFSGASMLCYVTPKEHLGLPTAEDVREGVIAHKIAAHAADVALKKPGARERDDRLSKARAALDWDAQFAEMLDPERAREYYTKAGSADPEATKHGVCSMCGPKFCAVKNHNDIKNACRTPSGCNARISATTTSDIAKKPSM